MIFFTERNKRKDVNIYIFVNFDVISAKKGFWKIIIGKFSSMNNGFKNSFIETNI